MSISESSLRIASRVWHPAGATAEQIGRVGEVTEPADRHSS